MNQNQIKIVLVTKTTTIVMNPNLINIKKIILIQLLLFREILLILRLAFP